MGFELIELLLREIDLDVKKYEVLPAIELIDKIKETITEEDFIDAGFSQDKYYVFQEILEKIKKNLPPYERFVESGNITEASRHLIQVNEGATKLKKMFKL